MKNSTPFDALYDRVVAHCESLHTTAPVNVNLHDDATKVDVTLVTSYDNPILTLTLKRTFVDDVDTMFMDQSLFVAVAYRLAATLCALVCDNDVVKTDVVVVEQPHEFSTDMVITATVVDVM